MNQESRTASSLFVRRIGRLLSMNSDLDDDAAGTPDAALVIRDGTVEYAGPEADLDMKTVRGLPILDAGMGLVTPGLVDCHTHLVFAGSRSDEFEARGKGLSYEEITRRGGGIMRTVEATRQASRDELFEGALPRVWKALRQGITTLDVMSGYGLDLASELRILEVVRDLDEATPCDIVPTFLGAHTIPPEAKADRARHVDAITREWIPAVVEAGLARFCDCFCETVAFNRKEAEQVLLAGTDAGLLPKIHADQLSHSGGSQLAAEIGAVSAAHLDFASRKDLDAMAENGVVGVLLPGCGISLGLIRFPEGAPFFEAGMKVALSTDFNPGTSMTQNLTLMGTLAMAYMGMNVGRTWAAITSSAAEALGLGERVGRLVSGYAGDLVVFHTDDPREPFYEYGGSQVSKVVKNGEVVVQRSPEGEITISTGM